MLVLVTLLCVWLGLNVRQVESQKVAVAWVKETGGDVESDEAAAHANELDGAMLKQLAVREIDDAG